LMLLLMPSLIVLFVWFDLSLLRFFFFSSRRRHTRFSRDWSSDVCSSDLRTGGPLRRHHCPPGWIRVQPWLTRATSRLSARPWRPTPSRFRLRRAKLYRIWLRGIAAAPAHVPPEGFAGGCLAANSNVILCRV